MTTVNESRDEVRYAGILDCLAGRWRFDPGTCGTEPANVDVAATNQALVLGGRKLRDFNAIAPGNGEIPMLSEVARSNDAISPSSFGVILLCGGLGTRSDGKFHPLLEVTVPNRSKRCTLLQLRLEQLKRSPLAESGLFIMCSPLNEQPLRQHLSDMNAQNTRLFCGGLVSRLKTNQPSSGSPLVYRDDRARAVYNPCGHFDALRWLVVSGSMKYLLDREIVMVASYSNVGKVFTQESLQIAARLRALQQQDPACIMLAEVVARPQSKRTGSMLVRDREQLHLVKRGYGQGSPTLPPGDQVLMSTNTLYFSVSGLVDRLRSAQGSIGRENGADALPDILQDGSKRLGVAQMADLFDRAFPVMPQVSIKKVGKNDSLQAERDLDQASLLDKCTLNAVHVPQHRAVSLKVQSDLEESRKREFIFFGTSDD